MRDVRVPDSSPRAEADERAVLLRLSRLEGRAARLERSNRRQRVALLTLTAILGATGLVAARLPPQRVVEAQAFVVRDQAGRARAQLGVAEDVPALSLYDTAGVLRAALAIEPEGPILNLFGPGGEPRAVLAEREQRSFLVLRDAAGAPRAAMAVQDSGEPSLYLLDETLTPVWRAPGPDPQR